MRKAIVYDKWLHTLGGGEVVACQIAKSLSNSYQVTLVSDLPVSKNKIKQKIGIKLENTKLLPIYFDENKLSLLTANADLFINTSFMNYVVGKAKKNVYYVHFPTENLTNFTGAIKREVLLPLLNRYFQKNEGISNTLSIFKDGHLAYQCRDNHFEMKYLKLISEQEYKIVVPIYLETFDFLSIKNININVENAKDIRISYRVDHKSNVVLCKIVFRASKSNIKLSIYCKDAGENVTKRNNGILIVDPTIQTTKHNNFVPKKILDKIQLRLRAGTYTNMSARLDSYDLFLSNSKYTSRWVKKYWKKDSVVVYPPVNLINQKKIKRKNWIVSTGRFFKLGHGKKQEVLIKAFKKLHDMGYKDWELHLVGGLNDLEEDSLEYFKYLQGESEGYPIYFHVNATRDELERILNTAKIYWHAAGYKVKKPVQKEHFGISIVEAISAGCIPVVIDEGGIPEIIKDLGLLKKNHLYKSINTLLKITNHWIKNEEDYVIPSEGSLANLYSAETFKIKLFNNLE